MTVTDIETALLGRIVASIRRVIFELAGRSRTGNGPLELGFTDGNSLLFQPAPDGECLAVSVGPWTDPFTPPLSDENETFVKEHGKWTGLDISNKVPFNQIVGSKAEFVLPIRNLRNGVVGLEVSFSSVVLRAEVEADELIVDVLSMRRQI